MNVECLWSIPALWTFRKLLIVIHTGIKIKFLLIGVGSKFYEIIKNMYEVSKSCVKLQNHITDHFPINLGIKQGDNLNPTYLKYL